MNLLRTVIKNKLFLVFFCCSLYCRLPMIHFETVMTAIFMAFEFEQVSITAKAASSVLTSGDVYFTRYNFAGDLRQIEGFFRIIQLRSYGR